MTRTFEAFVRRTIGGAGLLALLSCGGGGSGGTTGAAAPQWVLVPENPAYVAYRATEAAGFAVAEQAPERFRPEDFVRAGGELGTPLPPPSVGGMCVFPAAYDLRELGRSTPASFYECGCGSCWTSATLGSLESSLAPGDVRDLSENHLQLGGWDGAKCFMGGGAVFAVPYLAAWRGPVDHADFDLCGLGNRDPVRLAVRAHVQNVWFLPQRQGPLDLCWIKWAVTHLGGLYAASTHDINTTEGTIYDPRPGGEIHAMTLVGWDDHFDRHRFYAGHPAVPPSQRVPPGDGAFLAKDNLGPTVGYDGHFWVSYYDGSFAVHPVAFTGEPVGNYARNYQWDPRGDLDSEFVYPKGNGTESWQGNVFTAVADEYVAAVGLFEFYDGATDYEVRVHLDPVGGPTSPAGPAATFEVALPMKGYFTVKLPTLVKVKKGQKFGVVLRGRQREKGWPSALSLERPGIGNSEVHASPGQSFLSADGVLWSDLTTLSAEKGDGTGTMVPLTQANLRIKAFTTQVLTASASLELADLSVGWELHNAGSEGGWVRPTGQSRVQVGERFEDVGDEFAAERYVDELGNEAPTDDGWVFVPPGERVTAFSSAWAAETAEQVAWRLHALDPYDGFTVSPGVWKVLNELLATPLHVLSSDPAPGATVNVPAVPVLTVTYDAALKVGPGLLGITLSSGAEVRTVYATVLGSVLQLVPSKPLGAGLGLGGTTWHLHVPKDAVLSASLGKPLVNDYDLSFTVVGVN